MGKAEFSCKPKAIANLFDIAEVRPKMESLQSPKRTCSYLGKAQPKMEALDIVNTQPILDEVNFRANESRGQTCLDYAECSLSWAKPKIVIFSGFRSQRIVVSG